MLNVKLQKTAGLSDAEKATAAQENVQAIVIAFLAAAEKFCKGKTSVLEYAETGLKSAALLDPWLWRLAGCFPDAKYTAFGKWADSLKIKLGEGLDLARMAVINRPVTLVGGYSKASPDVIDKMEEILLTYRRQRHG